MMEEWKFKPARDADLSPEARLRSVRRESGLFATMSQVGWRAFTRAYLGAYHRLRIHGLEHVPARPPFVMVANHCSHLDALTLAAALPWRLRRHAFPIAAGDTFFTTKKATAFAAFMLNALPMWRQRCGAHAMSELRARLLDDPAIFLIFPEGTRSRDGRMGRFKPGLGMILEGAGVPVVPCHIEGAFTALPPNARWPRPHPLSLRIGTPVEVDNLPAGRDGWRAMAELLESAVTALAPIPAH